MQTAATNKGQIESFCIDSVYVGQSSSVCSKYLLKKVATLKGFHGPRSTGLQAQPPALSGGLLQSVRVCAMRRLLLSLLLCCDDGGSVCAGSLMRP